jgi:endo-1,3(4)-beta-glucanase
MASVACLLCSGATPTLAAVVPMGSGSYTTTFPGTDAAGRNALPPGTPNLSGNAAGKPVPTNDWWSNFLTSNFGGNCFNYPLNYQSKTSGLVINNTVPGAAKREYRQPISDVHAIVAGTSGLAASKASVNDYSDWTVTLSWDDKFKATIGQGMPFTYFTKASAEVAQVTVHAHYTAGVTISGNKLLVLNNMNGANFVVYGPAGSTWTANGGTYTSTLNGKNYWSMAMLPAGAEVTETAAEFEKYAYVFPGNTQVAWKYTPSTGVVRTSFTTTPDVKEGSPNTMLQGLLPHQWAHLAPDSPQPGSYIYSTVRGQMKMLASNTFFVENTFRGILPTLPGLAKYSKDFGAVPGFDPAVLTSKLDALKNDAGGTPSNEATLTVTAPVMPLDLNADAAIDVLDLAALAAAWGTGNAGADLNGSGLVDDADLTLWLAGF